MDRSTLRPLAKVPPRRECRERGVEWSWAHGVRQDVIDYSARIARLEGRDDLTSAERAELSLCRDSLALVRKHVVKRHEARKPTG